MSSNLTVSLAVEPYLFTVHYVQSENMWYFVILFGRSGRYGWSVLEGA